MLKEQLKLNCTKATKAVRALVEHYNKSLGLDDVKVIRVNSREIYICAGGEVDVFQVVEELIQYIRGVCGELRHIVFCGRVRVAVLVKGFHNGLKRLLGCKAKKRDTTHFISLREDAYYDITMWCKGSLVMLHLCFPVSLVEELNGALVRALLYELLAYLRFLMDPPRATYFG